MNDATATYVTIVNVVILQLGSSTPEPDGARPNDDMGAEPRTRQQHAATDPADEPAADR